MTRGFSNLNTGAHYDPSHRTTPDARAALKLNQCVGCKERGHFCQATTTDDNDRPACIFCADGEPCPYEAIELRKAERLGLASPPFQSSSSNGVAAAPSPASLGGSQSEKKRAVPASPSRSQVIDSADVRGKLPVGRPKQVLPAARQQGAIAGSGTAPRVNPTPTPEKPEKPEKHVSKKCARGCGAELNPDSPWNYKRGHKPSTTSASANGAGSVPRKASGKNGSAAEVKCACGCGKDVSSAMMARGWEVLPWAQEQNRASSRQRIRSNERRRSPPPCWPDART